MPKGPKQKLKLYYLSRIMVGIFIDRFGRDIMIHPSKQEGWSETNIDVALSDQFFGWIFALGTGVRIVSPEDVVERFRKEIKAMGEMYS